MKSLPPLSATPTLRERLDHVLARDPRAPVVFWALVVQVGVLLGCVVAVSFIERQVGAAFCLVLTAFSVFWMGVLVRGHVRLAAWGSVLGPLVVNLAICFVYGGIQSPSASGLVVPVVLAALVLDWPAAVAVAATAVLAMLGIAALDARGYPLGAHATVFETTLGVAACVLMAAALAGLAQRQMRQALSRSKDSESATRRALDARVDELQRRCEAEARLERALEAATDASEARAQFLAHVGRELRTPIDAIEHATDAWAKRSSDPAADTLRTETGALRIRVDDLLDLAALDAGRPLVRALDRVDVQEILTQVLAMVEPLAGHRSNRVDHVTVPIEPLRCDPYRVRQVLRHLLTNAHRFTTNGVVGVTAHEACLDGAPHLAIAVRDTGRGIAEALIPHLLVPFAPSTIAAARAGDSSGLGLALVAHLVRRMGARLTIDSTVGRGSTFTLWMPREPVEDPTPTPSLSNFVPLTAADEELSHH